MFDFAQMVHKTVTYNILLRFLALLTISLAFSQPCAADIPASSSASPFHPPGGDKIPDSFIKYQPDSSQFPADVRPVVTLLDAGLAVSDEKNARRIEKLQQARTATDNLIASLPRGTHDELLFLRGLADEGLNDDDAAIDDYGKSLSLRGSNATALFRRSAIFQRQKKFIDAAVGYREVIWRTHGNSYEALYALGTCYQELGDKVKAVRAWEKAYLLNTSYSPLLRQIISLRKDLINEAKTPEDKAKYQQQLYTSMQQLNASDPSDPETAFRLGKLKTLVIAIDYDADVVRFYRRRWVRQSRRGFLQ